MNSEGEYLWDKTGEPDPEVQQLEEILGTLRYQPQPLEIPNHLQTDRRPVFFSAPAPRLAPRLAIAAAILLVVLGLGLWLGLQRLQRAQSPAVAAVPNTPPLSGNPALTVLPTPNKDPSKSSVVTSSTPERKQIAPPRLHRATSPLLAMNANRSRNQVRKGVVKESQLALNELQEGKAAKDQLMLALRMASAKLSFAQKKMQNTNPRDPVHNQHKVG